MVDKLCQRFPNITVQQQAYDIAYCISLIPYKSDRTFKKLIENLKLYQVRMGDPTFFGYINDSIAKVSILFFI